MAFILQRRLASFCTNPAARFGGGKRRKGTCTSACVQPRARAGQWRPASIQKSIQPIFRAKPMSASVQIETLRRLS